MKIVIIDDHSLVRAGLKMVLSIEADIELVGEAGNIADALSVIAREKPELALVDLRLGKECGLDIIYKAKENASNCKFIILTSSSRNDDFMKAKTLGVEGYILKEALPDELLYAIRLVVKGRKYYDPGLMEMIVREAGDSTIEKLTDREKDVLNALGQGLTNNAIAKKLYITEHTVKKHVSQILAKLELQDRTQAAIYANSKDLVRYL